MSSTDIASTREVGAGRAFAGAFAAVAAAVRHVRREMEIARAQREMAAMSDTLLKDIGVDRVDIDLAARYGRGEHGRRFL